MAWLQTTSAAEAPPYSETTVLATPSLTTPPTEGSMSISTSISSVISTAVSTGGPISSQNPAPAPDTLSPSPSSRPPEGNVGVPSNTSVVNFPPSSISSSGPTSTLQGQPTTTPVTTTPVPNRRSSIGAIVGGLLGGLGLLALLTLAFIVCWRKRRRRRPTPPTLVPLAYDMGYIPPSPTKGRDLEVLNEKAAAHRQYTQLETEMEERNRIIFGDSPTASLILPGRDLRVPEAPVQRQVKYLSQRIMALEAQQRDLEDQLRDSHQAPPMYSG